MNWIPPACCHPLSRVCLWGFGTGLLILLIEAASVFPGEGILNRLVGRGCGNSADTNAHAGCLITAQREKNPFPLCTCTYMHHHVHGCNEACLPADVRTLLGDRNSFQPVGSSCRRERCKNLPGIGSRNSNLKQKTVFGALVLEQYFFPPFSFIRSSLGNLYNPIQQFWREHGETSVQLEEFDIPQTEHALCVTLTSSSGLTGFRKAWEILGSKRTTGQSHFQGIENIRIKRNISVNFFCVRLGASRDRSCARHASSGLLSAAEQSIIVRSITSHTPPWYEWISTPAGLFWHVAFLIVDFGKEAPNPCSLFCTW